MKKKRGTKSADFYGDYTSMCGDGLEERSFKSSGGATVRLRLPCVSARVHELINIPMLRRRRFCTSLFSPFPDLTLIPRLVGSNLFCIER